MSALHTRTAAMFPPPTIPTDLFDFILNNHRHDQIHHHLSLPVSTELMNKKIHTWQEKAINPLSSKVTYLPMFSLLHTGQSGFIETIAKIFQKHSNSPYHRFLCVSSLCFWSQGLFACLYFALHFSKIKSN